MVATRPWGECACGCGEKIKIGDTFHIRNGDFLKEGHPKLKKKMSLTRVMKSKDK